MLDLAGAPLALIIGLFALAGLVILFAGSKLAGYADNIADRTNFGEALVGAVLLGATTSLPGIVLSVAAAARGLPELAISNAIGGILAQTAFLAVADIVYRRANLEHAAASPENLAQTALLVCMLALALFAGSSPDLTFGWISVYSPVMIVGYLAGLHLLGQVKKAPMWQAYMTRETQDEQAETPDTSMAMSRLIVRFALLAALAALAGFSLTLTASELSARTGLSQNAVGGLLTAVVTSLPELVTSIAAVRAGALNLALGGIIGGNAFDVLFIAAADIGYLDGSLYGAFQPVHSATLAAATLMAGVLLLGLVRRERQGVGRIGFESALILLIYAVSVAVLITAGGA